ncbi:FadR/GntR family transcriptional regulator, partial [Cloacibacillus evryensis]
LSQLVLDSIQNSIRDGEFKPGEALPSERELSERYGVGKSSIREAIKMLQVLGVVESAQGKGTYLRKSLGFEILRPLLLDMMLQRSNAEELYEFRLMFDQAYLRLAAAKATEEEKIAARHTLTEYAIQQRAHLPEADRSDQKFHRIMLDATQNQFIIKMGTLIMELCRPYISKSNEILDETVMENHEKLLEIFCTGNTDGLEDAVKKSLIVFRHTLDTEMDNG